MCTIPRSNLYGRPAWRPFGYNFRHLQNSGPFNKLMAHPSPTLRTAGFSLLEMVVAIAIMAISLSALYQAVGGATRTVTVDEKMAYAVELARSLVADHAVVPSDGVRESGGTQSGFSWLLTAEPVVFPEGAPLPEGMLQSLAVAVSWPDGEKERVFKLQTVVAGQKDFDRQAGSE